MMEYSLQLEGDLSKSLSDCSNIRSAGVCKAVDVNSSNTPATSPKSSPLFLFSFTYFVVDTDDSGMTKNFPEGNLTVTNNFLDVEHDDGSKTVTDVWDTSDRGEDSGLDIPVPGGAREDRAEDSGLNTAVPGGLNSDREDRKDRGEDSGLNTPVPGGIWLLWIFIDPEEKRAPLVSIERFAVVENILNWFYGMKIPVRENAH